MDAVRLDMAVFGSTPMAKLLAGILAGTHGKRVVLIGESDAAFRLTRGADLSVAPITRPETWALLSRTVPETLRLVARAGAKAGFARIDPIFYARGSLGSEALAHVRHAAAGFGHAAERIPSQALGQGYDGLLLRDAVLLVRPQLEPLLDTWLRSLGVLSLARSQTRVEMRPGGGVSIASESGMEAERAVLADDEAILAHMDASKLQRIAALADMTSILTEPAQPLASPFMMEIEEDAHLLQRASGSITAIALGSAPDAVSTVGRLLARQQHLRRAGQVTFTRLIPRDGAPLVGRVADGPLILAGLGLFGAFLSPAIGRWICGSASPNEEAWFAAHRPGRNFTNSSVAEVMSARAIEAAA